MFKKIFEHPFIAAIGGTVVGGLVLGGIYKFSPPAGAWITKIAIGIGSFFESAVQGIWLAYTSDVVLPNWFFALIVVATLPFWAIVWHLLYDKFSKPEPESAPEPKPEEEEPEQKGDAPAEEQRSKKEIMYIIISYLADEYPSELAISDLRLLVNENYGRTEAAVERLQYDNYIEYGPRRRGIYTYKLASKGRDFAIKEKLM